MMKMLINVLLDILLKIICIAGIIFDWYLILIAMKNHGIFNTILFGIILVVILEIHTQVENLINKHWGI